jgi:hypothetical protein
VFGRHYSKTRSELFWNISNQPSLAFSKSKTEIRNKKKKETDKKNRKGRGQPNLGRARGPDHSNQPEQQPNRPSSPTSPPLSHRRAGPACQILLPRNHLPFLSIPGNGRRLHPAISRKLMPPFKRLKYTAPLPLPSLFPSHTSPPDHRIARRSLSLPSPDIDDSNAVELPPLPSNSFPFSPLSGASSNALASLFSQ